MPTETEPFMMEENGWTVRVQPPQEPGTPRSLLLIHGWTGNETVMWIFTSRLPKTYWMFAPRGPVFAGNGYAWLQHTGGWNQLEDFIPPANKLLAAFEQWAAKTGAPADTFDVMGFSQGAAMAYTLAALYPQRVNHVIALAGYLPRDPQNRYTALKGKTVYIAHGSADEIIPVKMAQEAVQTLQGVGADVVYCESNVGHKLSANCLRGVEDIVK